MFPEIVDDIHQQGNVMVGLFGLDAHVILCVFKQVGNQGIYLGPHTVVCFFVLFKGTQHDSCCSPYKMQIPAFHGQFIGHTV